MTRTFTVESGQGEWSPFFNYFFADLFGSPITVTEQTETRFSFDQGETTWIIEGTGFSYANSEYLPNSSIPIDDPVFLSGSITSIRRNPESSSSTGANEGAILTGLNWDAASLHDFFGLGGNPLLLDDYLFGGEMSFVVNGGTLSNLIYGVSGLQYFFAEDYTFALNSGDIFSESGAGNDTFTINGGTFFWGIGGRGDDTITDLANVQAFSGYRDVSSAYDITIAPDGTVTVHSDIAIDAGTDTLIGVETLVFADGHLDLATGAFTDGLGGLPLTSRSKIDANDNKAWDRSSVYYDAETGREFFRITEFDNGMRVTQDALGSVVRFQQDLGNAHNWANIVVTSSNSGGTETFFEYDDGRARALEETNGIRRSDSWFDAQNAYAWEGRVFNYDQFGRLEERIDLLDNGVEKVFAYDANGALETLTSTDGADQFNWVETVDQFDAGTLQMRTRSLDNGNTFEITYENGQRSQTVLTDTADLGRWTTITQTYDANGDLVDKVTVYDDGSSVVDLIA